ncbi:hypothetical protein R54876_GBNLAHCA_01012 [Eupransor demetentiae]|uniref:Uncharacterized protein n=1 Tax=Eupransor demetentiae TaxID=3109584 RepID=A0ABM9N5I2_9LACO|nr:hypothetical protein R54876_GBNLAHCA_01012 [Lactobacillaceae bacterium LMG 33000]
MDEIIKELTSEIEKEIHQEIEDNRYKVFAKKLIK